MTVLSIARVDEIVFIKRSMIDEDSSCNEDGIHTKVD